MSVLGRVSMSLTERDMSNQQKESSWIIQPVLGSLATLEKFSIDRLHAVDTFVSTWSIKPPFQAFEKDQAFTQLKDLRITILVWSSKDKEANRRLLALLAALKALESLEIT